MAFQQGWFTPRNPEKYIGDVTKIRYMSSWELNFHTMLDGNPNVLAWSSESVAIPYISPLDGRMHKYFPDYLIKYQTGDGNIKMEMIEVKPMKQVKKPTKRSSQYEQATFVVNMAKWAAAKAYCEANGIAFRIVTEEQLFNRKKTTKGKR